MKSWVAGALRGTQAAAGKYGQIQDEQRKFKNDQTKAAADDMRKRRFTEFNYELKDSYTSSGTIEEGRELTKKEAAIPALEGKKRMSKIEFEAQKKVEAEETALEKTIAAEERGVERQTEGEIRRKELAKEGEKEKATKKASAEKKKEDTAYLKEVDKNVRRAAKEIDTGDRVVDNILATMEEGDIQQDERFLDSESYKSASEVMRATEYFMTEFEEQKGVWASRKEEIRKTKEALIDRGAPKDQIDKVIRVLEAQGKLK